MHQRSISVSCHSHGRTSPAARPRVSEDARVCGCPAAEKEGGSTVCGTEESDRTPPLTLAQTKVRTRAVLFSGNCAEPEAAGPVPQPACETCTSYRLEIEGRKPDRDTFTAKKTFCWPTFSTPTPVINNHFARMCQWPSSHAYWSSMA